MSSILYFTISFVFGISLADGKEPTNSDFKSLSKKITACLKKEDKKCLEKMVVKSMYFDEFESFGCKAKMLSPEIFSDCVFTSAKKFTDAAERRTLKEVLLDCFTDSSTKIKPDSMLFESVSGYHCSVEMEDGSLKLSNIRAYD